MNISLLLLFIICAVFFSVYKFFKNSQQADTYTLLPMRQWIVLANSRHAGGVEKMSYSLLIQSGAILEKNGVITLSELRRSMRGLSSFRKENFIILAVKTAESISYENGRIGAYRNSLENSEARFHLAYCFSVLISNHIVIDELANASTYQSEFKGKGLSFILDVGKSFGD